MFAIGKIATTVQLFENILQNLFVHCSILKTGLTTSNCDNSKPKNKTSNVPHPPKDPPDDYNPECVNHKAFEAPDYLPAAIFRPFSSECEVLGPGADKNGCYKNCEYFSYHRFSFVALQLATLQLRNQQKNNNEVRLLYKKESDDDNNCSDDSD